MWAAKLYTVRNHYLSFRIKRVCFPLYIWTVGIFFPAVVAIGDLSVLGNSACAQPNDEQLSLEARDSDRGRLPVRAAVAQAAASSGIAVLSPALFTLVTLQHLKLTPGMSYTGSAVARGSVQGGHQRRQTLCLLCNSSPLIGSKRPGMPCR